VLLRQLDARVPDEAPEHEQDQDQAGERDNARDDGIDVVKIPEQLHSL
jgi:hypothetical protein